MAKPDYAEAYAELETEFAVAREMIEARTRVGLTQDGGMTDILDELQKMRAEMRDGFEKLHADLAAILDSMRPAPYYYDAARAELRQKVEEAVRAELNRHEDEPHGKA